MICKEKMMKNSLLKVLILLFLLSSCTPKQEIPIVKSSWVLPYDMDSYTYPQIFLSYDGNYLISGDFRFLDVETGEISFPMQGFLPQSWLQTHFAHTILWSDIGNLMIAETHRSGGILPVEWYMVYFIDIENQKISEGYEIGPIISSSPFGNHIIANPAGPYDRVQQSYDIEAKEALIFNKSPQNIENLKTGGNDSYLWDENSNAPIARELLRHTYNDNGEYIAQVGYLLLYQGYQEGIAEDFSTEEILYESNPPDNVVAVTFDPSGDYLVVTKWECDPDSVQQCTNEDPDTYYTDNVLDTVILLIDWRTGEEYELFRLSDIVSDHLIGSYTDWSMDGSTLILWRYNDDLPVILRIKYP